MCDVGLNKVVLSERFALVPVRRVGNGWRPHYSRSVVHSRRLSGFATIALGVALSGACSGDDSPEGEPGISGEVRQQSQAPPSATESTALTLDQVAQRVEENLHAFDGVATGAIVLVRIGDQTRTFASGTADVKHRRRMQPDDRFPIMSITKTMVATTVLQLVADEKLKLNDTVEDIVPGLLPQGNRITIRDLLSHRSGLYDLSRDHLPPPRRMTDDSLIDAAAAHPLEFPPGTSGIYSNAGYEVLARVVERITGKSLAEAMAINVFGPAGMSDTKLLGPPTVLGYNDSKVIADPYLRFISAAGGVVSTVADIDRFYTALWRGDLLDKQLVATMTEPLGVVAPMQVEYGLGVWFDPADCGTALGHSGAGPGFATKAWTLPDADRSVVVMVNDGDGDFIADTLAASALCDY